jgi:RNA polymerase sigma factor (sigma-70 family)
MPDEAQEFADLMRRVREGDQQAAWDLLESYGSHLLRSVRRSLGREMRARYDSIDFVQVVWASFFREPEKLQRLTTPAELMAYLTALARNKVVSEVRETRAQKRDVRREIRLDAIHRRDDSDLASRDPTPSAVAIYRERWNRLVDGQPSMVKKVIERRVAGATYTEIAAELQIHERTARKVVERLLRRVDTSAEPLESSRLDPLLVDGGPGVMGRKETRS